jgi:hypothetical protein
MSGFASAGGFLNASSMVCPFDPMPASSKRLIIKFRVVIAIISQKKKGSGG